MRSALAFGALDLVFVGALLAASRSVAARGALPALGVLDGPLGAALLAAVLLVAVGRALAARGTRAAAPPPAALLLASFALLALVGARYAAGVRTTGDEPHYLVAAQSLWREGDLDLRDNYARGDHREHTPGEIAPHYGQPRRDGRPFPSHSVGLPVLLAPVYGLGGRTVCVALLAAMGAALALVVRSLALRATRSAPAALAAWAAAIGPPVFFYSFHLYTEVPSALALAGSLRLLLHGSPGLNGAVGAALLASALPWLHVKMIPAAAVLGLVAFFRLSGLQRFGFFLVAGAMAAGFLLFYQDVFGSASPLALYGGVPRDARGGEPLRALAGLLLDRSFGLLPHAPVFLVALAGFVLWLRRGPEDGLTHLALGAAVLAPVLAWRMWWGGQCPPARLLVPLVPLLGVAIAHRVAGGEPCGLARWHWPLSGLGLALALFMALQPGGLYLVNRGDRPTRVWAALSGEGAPAVGSYLPSLVAAAPADVRIAVVWLGAAALLLALDREARHRAGFDALFRTAATPLGLLLLGGAAIDYWARS